MEVLSDLGFPFGVATNSVSISISNSLSDAVSPSVAAGVGASWAESLEASFSAGPFSFCPRAMFVKSRRKRGLRTAMGFLLLYIRSISTTYVRLVEKVENMLTRFLEEQNKLCCMSS